MTAGPPLPLPDKPYIVVLPFNNMSGDPEQEFLADGLADDITTLLSNLRWLFVVARYSAFTYKGQVVNITDVGRDLGVRYVLESSVRNIVGMLETEIASVEQVASVQRPANLDAWTAYQRGMSGLANSYDPAELGQSIADFETAVRLDPKFAAAHAGLAVPQILFPFWSKIDETYSQKHYILRSWRSGWMTAMLGPMPPWLVPIYSTAILPRRGRR
jgi:adenylate cyclase